MCEQKQITGTFCRCWPGSCVDVAVIVEMGVGDADGLQLGDEHAAEILLLLGRGRGRESGSDWVSMVT